MSAFPSQARQRAGDGAGSSECVIVNLLSSDDEDEEMKDGESSGGRETDEGRENGDTTVRKKPRLMTQAELDKESQIHTPHVAHSNPDETPTTPHPPTHPSTPSAPAKADDTDEDLQVVSCVLAARAARSGGAGAQAAGGAEGDGTSKLGVFSPTERRGGRRGVREGGQCGGNESVAAATRRRNTERGNDVGANEPVQVVDCRRGVNALVDYAHFRFQCVTKPFKHKRRLDKLDHCDKCFCYVCDDPADKCASWQKHYEATDSGNYWRKLREESLHARRKQKVDLAQAGSQFARVQQPELISLLGCDAENDREREGGASSTHSAAHIVADESDSEDDHASVGSLDDMLWYDTDDVNDVIRDASAQLEEIRLTPNTFSMTALASLLDASRNVKRSSSERLVAQPYDPAIFD